MTQHPPIRVGAVSLWSNFCARYYGRQTGRCAENAIAGRAAWLCRRAINCASTKPGSAARYCVLRTTPCLPAIVSGTEVAPQAHGPHPDWGVLGHAASVIRIERTLS